ncbi:HAD-IIA family hydrolase [Boudabousia liubingyangii]|uniref:HAD-IIA family hydrolase n=1 Tax=Boudabousia liubingyangii TaxID=1921764 RepID=UPI000A6DADFE|nr:HAD-IIA family hydrolase [Boudabousia liubingyangii]
MAERNYSDNSRSERNQRSGGFGGRRDDRREGGRRWNDDRRDGGRREGGFGGRRDDRREGGFGGRRDDRRDGGRRWNDDRRDGGRREGGFGGRRDDRREGGFGGRRDDRREGGFGGRRDDRRDGGRREGGFGGRRDDRREGGFGGRRDDRRDGGRREGGFGGRRDDRRDGGRRWNDDRRDGGRREGGFGGRRDDRNGRTFDERRESHAARAARLNNEPEIPGDIKAEDLDRQVSAQLRTLSGANAETVARHLAAAGHLIDEEPELAYEHAMAAVARAGRVDVVREAAALTAYQVGKYEEALREVRAVRRLSGTDSLRAVEADCERAAGRPLKAIEIIEQTDFSTLDLAEQVEVIIVGSAARADLGENAAALVMVDDALAQLPKGTDEYLTGRLLSVKADRLRELGREEEAAEIEANLPEEIEESVIFDLEEIVESDFDNLRSDLRGCSVTLTSAYDVALYDLDGVCYRGTDPIEYAAESIEKAREAGLVDVYVTNNASRTPKQVAKKLKGLGINADPGHVMTAALDIVGIMEGDLEPGAKVLVVGGDGLKEAVSEAGFEVVKTAAEEPAAAVQGWASDVDWAQLSEVAYAVNNGARYYASNLDASLPTEVGFALGNGALAAAVIECTGRRPFAGGKPFPGIYRKAAALVSEDAKVLSVGDRLETDIQGARSARIPALHVLTGVHGPRDVVMCQSNQRPSFVGLDLRALDASHPQPRHHTDGAWSCGTSEPVHVDRWGNIFIGEEELTTDSSLTLDHYRALLAAAWEKLDAGHRVKCPQFQVVPNEEGNNIIPLPEPEFDEEAADDEDQDLFEENEAESDLDEELADEADLDDELLDDEDDDNDEVDD